MPRRHFCLCCLGGAAFAATGEWLSPQQAFAEARGLVSLIKDSAATSPIVTHKLRNNISVLEGSGGNMAVLTGPDGKVLVDAGIGVSRAQITRPWSHWARADHASDQHALAFRSYRRQHMANEAGAKIIAHENTRKHLSQVQRVEDWDYNFLPLPPGGSRRGLRPRAQSGAQWRLAEPQVLRQRPTDSDISVTFGEADVIHVADTFWNGVYPFIDYSTGGSIDGMIAASDANLAATTDNTVIIAGHGRPVSNKAELKNFRDMLVAVRENVAALKKQGRSRDEAVAAKPTAAFDAIYGNFVIDPGFFTRLVYEGV